MAATAKNCGAVVKRCDCKANEKGTQGAEFQDARYGPGMRVHNLAGKGGDKARCTICGKEK